MALKVNIIHKHVHAYIRGRSQIFFATVSVIVMLRGGGGGLKLGRWAIVYVE